jgi:hypothetical protein
MNNILINQVKKIIHRNALKKGFAHFQETGISTHEAYIAMRNMFILTGGASNDKLSAEIMSQRPKYLDINPIGVLGDLSGGKASSMVAKMEQDGYYIFDKVLNEDVVDEVYKYASTTPTSYLDLSSPGQKYSTNEIVFDESKPISPRYQFANSKIVSSPHLVNLLFDQSLLFFAQEYLGCKPILDLVAFWWSLPFQGQGKSEAAQLYHFDLDRIKFMKFFFYITDVDTNNGPHCYVRGSHRVLPKSLARDGRFSDDEIEKNYGKSNMVEICGKKGSIIAVDTRGFHKGKELIQGKRLLFQIEFANSMFGQSYPPIDIKLDSEAHQDMYSKYIDTYGEILQLAKA